MNNFKCLKSRCYSPTACGGFGYCRERNFDDCPQDQANVNRRRAESEAEAKGQHEPRNSHSK